MLGDNLGIEPGSEVIFKVREKEVVMNPFKASADVVEEYVSIVASKLKSRIQLEKIIEEEAFEEIAIHR